MGYAFSQGYSSSWQGYTTFHSLCEMDNMINIFLFGTTQVLKGLGSLINNIKIL
jgi:hypothetical protein